MTEGVNLSTEAGKQEFQAAAKMVFEQQFREKRIIVRLLNPQIQDQEKNQKELMRHYCFNNYPGGGELLGP